MSTFRTAGLNEFTFKRDSAGVETVEHQGLIVCHTDGPNNISMIPGLAGDSLAVALAVAVRRADDAGFWSMGRPAHKKSPVSCMVRI